MFSAEYIQAVLLRAQRAMLIISEKIQNRYLYLYSASCKDYQYKQRDIYILWNTLTDNYPYRASYSTYDALINVLIGKCQEVDSFNITYSTLNPNYENIDGNIVVVPDPTYVIPVRVYFTNETTVTLDWDTYRDTFGNDPTTAIYLPTGETDQYALYEGASPVLTSDGSGELQTIVYDFGVAYTGYVLIST